MEPLQLTLLIVLLFFVLFILISLLSKKQVDEFENGDNVKIIEKEVIIDKTDHDTLNKLKGERDYFISIADNKQSVIERLNKRIKEIETQEAVIIQNNKIPNKIIQKAKELKESDYFHIIITHDSIKDDIIKKFPDERYSVVVDKIQRIESTLGRYNIFILSKAGIKSVKVNRIPKEFSNIKK